LAGRIIWGEDAVGEVSIVRRALRRVLHVRVTVSIGLVATLVGTIGLIGGGGGVAAAKSNAAPPTPSCIVSNLLTDGATAVYPLSESSGDTAYDATNTPALNATISSAASYNNVPGPLGCSSSSGALGFDGASSGVGLPPVLNPTTQGGAFTVLTWFNANNLARSSRLVDNAETNQSNMGFELELDNGGATGYFDVATASTSPCTVTPCGAQASWTNYDAAHSPTPLTTNVWHLYAGTYNGSTVTAYVDGVPVGSAPATGSIIPSTTSVTVGYDAAEGPVHNVAGDFFSGLLGDVALFPYALSASTLAALYSVSTVASSIDPGPNWGLGACGTPSSAVTPPGTYAVGVDLKGAGGGGGGTNTGSGGAGGNGGELNGTLPSTGGSTLVGTRGCGGSPGSEAGFTTTKTQCLVGATGGGGFGAGGDSGGSCETNSDAYLGAATGGGGGGSSALCLGSCATLIGTAGGGGGGGARLDCSTNDAPGAGGSGAFPSVGAFSPGWPGTNGGDAAGNSDGGGGGQLNAGGTAGNGKSGDGGVGNATLSPGAPGGTGGAGRGAWAAASAGGGGGGYNGGGGGGGDGCDAALTGGPAVGGGGGGGSSFASPLFAGFPSFGPTGAGGGASGQLGTDGSITTLWYVAHVAIATPPTQHLVAGQSTSLALVAGDSQGLPLHFTATGLPPGLTFDFVHGVISGVVPTTPGLSFFRATVTATDPNGASATTRKFSFIIRGSGVSPFACAQMQAAVEFATPGVSMKGSTTTSSTSKDHLTLAGLSQCLNQSTGATLKDVHPPSPLSVTFQNTKNPPVTGRPTTYTYDTFKQLEDQLAGAIKKSVKSVALSVGGKRVVLTVSSVFFVLAYPCGPSELGVGINGVVATKPFTTKYARMMLCFGGDAGPNTTNNFAQDIQSSSAVITRAYLDKKWSWVTF
jgi:Concanavalin A-like lectin/glucanases superfamily